MSEQPDRAFVSEALDFAVRQSRRILENYPGYHPMYTVDGRWGREGEKWTSWCEGFFPGLLWILAECVEPELRAAAEEYTARLEPRKNDRNVHDLGFLFGSTFLRQYRATGDRRARDIVIEAGQTLALRRQRGGYLASFIGPHSLFIDIMMNVPLVLWTARQTDDEHLRKIALDHADVTREHLVRQDGSTAHEGIFDTETGNFVGQSTHQGWKPESAWARGQAWALYGFTMMGRLCDEPCRRSMLETAQRCADFWLSRVPNGSVPLWDLDVPDDGRQPRDSSAAAIAASGLWDLSEVAEPRAAMRYRAAAIKHVETLCSPDYLAVDRPEWEGILMHGVYHLHKNLGVDESVAWGEYYFVEALAKVLRGSTITPWYAEESER